MQQKSTLKKTEMGHRNFLNAVEERATLLLPGLISREAHPPFSCVHTCMHTHTHLCPRGEMFRSQRFQRHSNFLPGFKGPKQHKNLRINQMTAEENLKMQEIDTKGNVNTLIFKPTLLTVCSAQCPPTLPVAKEKN